MSDILTTIQIACIIVLAIGGPAYAVLQLYWRAEAAEEQLRNERLKSSRLEREVQLLRQALAAAQHHDTDTRAGASGSVAQVSDAHEVDAQEPSE
jgi:hypothetical protein